MRISEICIERPVLASVMSLVILLFGILALLRLPNRELPDTDPPVISVTTVFPGAAPEVVETSVTSPLEDEIIGIEGVEHVTSLSREQVSVITVEFSLDRDLEAAANDVRDRVARSRGRLPEDVNDPVVAKRDSDSFPIMWLALASPRHDQIQLSRIAETQIKDRLGKLPGVVNVIVAGERRYSMRIWIDNDRLTAHRLTIADVTDALRRENVDIPSGRIESRDREFTVRSLGELRSASDYESLIVNMIRGEPVRLRDVARVEVGPEDVRKLVRFNGEPALGIGVVKQSKTNTLTVAEAARVEIKRIQADLPKGVVLHTAYDAADFIEQSIRDVRRTIFEAAILVVLVIYVFLRTVRATIIPAVAIPVSIVGAFAVLYFTGFTINTLTLMGVTLAIGLVVDDAIVVLENIARWIEQGYPPLEAARRGMKEISFAVVAATVSATAVFLPLTFLTDTTGRLFREFAVTVASALLISGFVALTLSPALCALVLRPQSAEESPMKARLARAFDSLLSGYGRLLRPILSRPTRVVVLGSLWVGLGIFLYQRVDQELMPTSDRSVMLAFTRAPEGSTLEYTDRYQREAESRLLAMPEVARVFSVVALGMGTPGVVNEGFAWTTLVPPSARERSQQEVVRAAGDELADITGITAYTWNPSPMRGFRGTPVSLVIQGPDIRELSRLSEELQARMEEVPGIISVRDDLFLDKPQLEVAIDRERASDLGVSVRDIATTLQILLGGQAVSSFKLEGETYDVIAQLPRTDRANPRDLLGLFVRANDGDLVSLYSLVVLRETIAPRALPHFDRLRSVTISADLGDELSQGDALERVSELAAEVVPAEGSYRVAFTGESERFLEAGNSLAFAYGFAIVVVFLVLAAQFESFVHPLTILVAVALSFTGALLTLSIVGIWFEPATLNLYSKIGLVMLVGLVTKNSILIVEFANQLRARGLDLVEATFEACRIRFRPILMTALATIMGILPIALGLGAGGESRAPLGIAVVGGMLFSTVLTFAVVPATYVAVERLRGADQRASGGVGREQTGGEPPDRQPSVEAVSH